MESEKVNAVLKLKSSALYLGNRRKLTRCNPPQILMFCCCRQLVYINHCVWSTTVTVLVVYVKGEQPVKSHFDFSNENSV